MPKQHHNPIKIRKAREDSWLCMTQQRRHLWRWRHWRCRGLLPDATRGGGNGDRALRGGLCGVRQSRRFFSTGLVRWLASRAVSTPQFCLARRTGAHAWQRLWLSAHDYAGAGRQSARARLGHTPDVPAELAWLDGQCAPYRVLGTPSTTAQVHPEKFTRALLEAALSARGAPADRLCGWAGGAARTDPWGVC